MAKNPHKEAQKKLVWRTNKYASKVGKLYSQAVNDLLDVTKKVNTAAKKGEMFSYEDNPEMAKAASDILRRLHSDTYAAVKHGIQLEWAEGNKAADQFLATHFGKQVLNDPNFAAWTSRNTDALEAFFKRTRDDGMTLSKRIWKQTKQLRGEMELAMTVSIGEGESAADISRRVRKYLKDPDKLFRRIKETQEDGSIKWKLSKAAAAYHPGRGMYRSSAKNAMRVARTETNIAYRTADAMRWEEMDFVTGVHVKLSHNHPTADICDVLQGIYPKNFVFKGWHPQCFCYAEPVTASYEDMVASSKAMLAGEQPPAPKDMVTELPDNFKKWVKENQGRIDQAQKNGHLPYFMKDNWDVIYKKSALQKAAERHAARTPEQIEAIKKKFKERQDTYKLGNSILSDMKQIPDIDTSALASALKTPDLTTIKAEAQKLAAIKDEITNLKLVVNPWEEAKTWGYQKIKSVEESVQTTIDKWLTKYGYKDWESAPLAHKKGKLEFEITELATKQNKYETWNVARIAYQNQLAIVQTALDWEEIELFKKSFMKDEFGAFLSGIGGKLPKGVTANKLNKLFSDLEASTIGHKNLLGAQESKIKIKDELESIKKKVVKKNTTNSGPIQIGNTEKQLSHIDPMGQQEQIETIMKLTGVDAKVAEELRSAVYGFSWQWDYEIRQVQCGNINFTSRHGHTLDEIKKKAENLEKFIDLSPKWSGGVTYRGISLSKLEVKQMLDNLENGICNMKGSASWSTEESVSIRFAGDHIGEPSEFGDVKTERVVLFSKTQIKGSSIRYISNFPGEREVLVSMLSKYKFVQKEKRGNYLFIEVQPSI